MLAPAVAPPACSSSARTSVPRPTSRPRVASRRAQFSPKGGPADLVGVWAAAPARTITWPDGNAWSKAPPALDHPRDDPRGQAVYAESLSASAARSGGSGSAGAGVFLALAGLLAAFAYVRRHSLRRAFEGRPMPRLWKPEHDRIRDYDVEPGA
jgi:hypothetical protein